MVTDESRPLGLNTSYKSDGGHCSERRQVAFIRCENDVQAMASKQRIRTRMKLLCNRICCGILFREFKEDIEANDEDLENRTTPAAPVAQYRLEATSKRKKQGMKQGFLSCLFRRSKKGSSTSRVVVKHNQRLASLLHWMFRVNFIFLFFVMCSIFFCWVILFSGFIVLAAKIDHDCVRLGGAPFSNTTSAFADAFVLSWTTLSTVGYGSTYPALGHENDSPTQCLFIALICSLESFFGVLYSGFCGAIMFGKVLRIQSHAQVIFSDPIVIRYGSGIKVPSNGNDTDDEADPSKRIPCPVLEFRLVNRLFAEVGGEIMDATLTVVANVDANDADPLPAAETSDNDSRIHARTISINSENSAGSQSSGIFSSGRESLLRSSFFRRGSMSGFMSNRAFTRTSVGHSNNNEDDDASSARIVNKRNFSKMMIEASDHPFFKRVWLGRHVLDENSPILKPRVRRLIHRNKGYWPAKLNSYNAVRESLQFNQILVSLNGVNNISASDVYAQKIYDFVDINVGYQFVNILYKDQDGALKVDTGLINDVKEQDGGGGEPLVVEE